jgi:phosphatidylglycerol lysyltransferase
VGHNAAVDVAAPRSAAAERALVRDLLRRHGTNPASFLAVYDGPWRYHLGREVEGVVAWIERGRSAVVWGDPVCAPDDIPALVREFTAEMHHARRRVCWLALQEHSARAVMAGGGAALKIGEEPVFDLATWTPPRGDPGKKLRWCLNHARRAGLVVEDYRPADGRDPSVEAEIVATRTAWEAGLGRRAVRSFLRAAPLDEIEHKRVFVARRDGRVEAVLACAPVEARGGWFLEDLMRVPGAVNGATELLVVEALRMLAADGARFASLGIAPLRRSDEQIDPRARWLSRWLRVGFERFDARYRFQSLSRFKAKFRPSAWEPRFVAFDPRRPSFGLVRSVIWVLDPPPAPEEVRPAPAPGRALVAVQALVLAVASLLVLAGDRLVPRAVPAARGVAPVGVAGAVMAVALVLLVTRLGRADGFAVRAAAVTAELAVALAALGRLHDGRTVALDLLSVGVAVAATLLLLRPAAVPGAPPP